MARHDDLASLEALIAAGRCIYAGCDRRSVRGGVCGEHFPSVEYGLRQIIITDPRLLRPRGRDLIAALHTVNAARRA